ncbi:MAG TPA: hypothetical protein VJL27_01190 [Patescibacteria group bacterium]|nr:hypothetical protein [Patescibacteria group bacterium]
MRHYKLLFGVFSITLLAFGGWFAILQSIDPYTYGVKGQILFYAFLAIFLWGVASMANYYFKQKRKDTQRMVILASAIRQGLIASLGLVGLTVLRSIDVLNVLSAAVYLVALVLIEFYFRNRKANYA